MNAIKLYVSTARLILESDHYDFTICKEITSTFPSLEQSLTCTVCRNLLNEPYSPTETSCQHHVCKACVGGRKKLRPSCSWCKDYTKYIKNSQLQCLLVCYKGLCEYIKCTNLLTQMTDFFPTFNESDKSIQSIIQKGTELPYGKDTKHTQPKNLKPRASENEANSQLKHTNVTFHSSLSSNNANINDASFLDVGKIKVETECDDNSILKSESIILSPIKNEHVPKLRENTDDFNSDSHGNSTYDSVTDTMENKPLYSVSFAGTRSKLILKRRPATTRREMRRDRVYEPNDQLPVSHSVNSQEYSSQQNTSSIESRFRKSKPKPIVNSDRPTCRCGNATPRPGKLTCCGQRCACYMQSKACTGCRCRGCRNPHMFDGVKVLGRFVEEDQQESNLVMGNSPPSYPELNPTFLNQQISYILPTDISGGTVLNIS